MGQVVQRPVRTTSKDEEGNYDPISSFDEARFFDFIRDIASSELGIHIPDPDPKHKERRRAA